MPYAKKTKVPAERTRAEIESLVRKHGADTFSSGWSDEHRMARIQFRTKERFVKFTLPLPDPRKTSRDAHDQAVRYRWRALLLIIKAKLEAVESGIMTFDQEFMAHIVMPNGEPFSEHALPAIVEAYKSNKMPKLLGGF